MNMKAFISCLLLTGHVFAQGPSNSSLSTNYRDNKSLGLFAVVTFKNEQCQASSDTETKGTCFSSTECSDKGGAADGNCAAGFGVCCTFILSACGGTLSKNCSYLTNSGYPTTTTSASTTCTYTVTPESSDICQLRLDFTTFVTAVDSTTTGLCNDFFTVSAPAGRNPPSVCGTLTGMHMYVETGPTSSSTTLTMTTGSDSTTARSWKIKVSQIECTSADRAPADCVQYFTGASGLFQSYNFDGGVITQTQAQSYCFRQEVGYCAIDYSVDEGTTSPDPFLLDTAISTTAIQIQACTISRLNIPFSVSGFICGGQFGIINADTDSGTIRVSAPPFMVHLTVNTASVTSSTGFRIRYNQVPC